MICISSDDGFKVSVEKAFDEIDPNWRNYKGLLITGTHAAENVPVEWALKTIQEARTKKLPTLGICFGLHLAVIEFSRNVLNLPEANSTELKPDTSSPVVVALPGVRVGLRPVINSLENHWHRYKVNNNYLHLLGSQFQIFMTREDEGDIAEHMTLVGHPFFVLTQYHPEYNSTKEKPHPVLTNFLKVCKQMN